MKWWESVYCGKWNTVKEIFTNYDTNLTGTISGTQQLYDSTHSTSQKLCFSTQLTFNIQKTISGEFISYTQICSTI